MRGKHKLDLFIFNWYESLYIDRKKILTSSSKDPGPFHIEIVNFFAFTRTPFSNTINYRRWKSLEPRIKNALQDWKSMVISINPIQIDFKLTLLNILWQHFGNKSDTKKMCIIIRLLTRIFLSVSPPVKKSGAFSILHFKDLGSWFLFIFLILKSISPRCRNTGVRCTPYTPEVLLINQQYEHTGYLRSTLIADNLFLKDGR